MNAMEKKNRFARLVAAIILILVICLIGIPSLLQRNQYEVAQQVAIQQPSLLYGYAAPTLQTPGPRQISEFNSFIGHNNTIEVYNTTDNEVEAVVDVVNFDGTSLFDVPVTLAARASARVPLKVEKDTYGTLLIQGEGVVFRNYISNGNRYVLTYYGK